MSIKSIFELKVSDLFKEDYISHHGIKGQRWGIRRYQNEDGTLTAEGKARYGSKDEKIYDSGSNNWKGKDARHLSDEELNRRNSRLQRERQYKDLTEPPIRKETKQMLKKVFAGSATGAAAGLMAVKYKSFLTSGTAWLASPTNLHYLGVAAVGGALIYRHYKKKREYA